MIPKRKYKIHMTNGQQTMDLTAQELQITEYGAAVFKDGNRVTFVVPFHEYVWVMEVK